MAGISPEMVENMPPEVMSSMSPEMMQNMPCRKTRCFLSEFSDGGLGALDDALKPPPVEGEPLSKGAVDVSGFSIVCRSSSRWCRVHRGRCYYNWS